MMVLPMNGPGRRNLKHPKENEEDHGPEDNKMCESASSPILQLSSIMIILKVNIQDSLEEGKTKTKHKKKRDHKKRRDDLFERSSYGRTMSRCSSLVEENDDGGRSGFHNMEDYICVDWEKMATPNAAHSKQAAAEDKLYSMHCTSGCLL